MEMIVHILQMWELKQRGIKDVPQITWRPPSQEPTPNSLCWMGDSEGPAPAPGGCGGRETNVQCLFIKQGIRAHDLAPV